MVTRARIFDLITAVGLPQLQRGLWLPFITVPKKKRERKKRKTAHQLDGGCSDNFSILSLSLFFFNGRRRDDDHRIRYRQHTVNVV